VLPNHQNGHEAPVNDVPRLHVIVNPTLDDPAMKLARLVLEAGAPLLQIRVKGVSDRDRLALTGPLVALCRQFGAQSVVNDRADICLATGAGGVHGGADDMPTTALRAVLGRGRLLGGTARNATQALAAEAGGADYVGAGPVYSTSSKQGLPAPRGPEVVRDVAAWSIPVIAIGGITPERVAEVVAAGAHGVAAIGAIAGAPDPARATCDFLDALGER
jgi:thiamine-phosphate pyrophosphorylase